ncbi:MAG: hypothetical protein HY550_02635 [Elusimicrobia bacterium]|nr:hypothetical protein [Elusimicrobiota bacterium]
MNEDELARVVTAGLEKSMNRMTEVSPGAWKLAGVRVYGGEARGTIRCAERAGRPAAAIRIKIKGAVPFVTAILFDPGDIKHISRCFAEELYYGPICEEQPDVTVIEIGNILLNALANALLRAFGKSAVPSVPAHFQGDCAAVERWLGAGPGLFTIVSARFTMEREGRSAGAEILGFLPPALRSPE